MEANTKGNGNKIKLMGKAPCIIPTEMFMRGNGRKTKQTAMENTRIRMEQSTQGNGKTISSMATESRNGWMVKSMRVSIKMAPRLETGC